MRKMIRVFVYGMLAGTLSIAVGTRGSVAEAGKQTKHNDDIIIDTHRPAVKVKPFYFTYICKLYNNTKHNIFIGELSDRAGVKSKEFVSSSKILSDKFAVMLFSMNPNLKRCITIMHHDTFTGHFKKTVKFRRAAAISGSIGLCYSSLEAINIDGSEIIVFIEDKDGCRGIVE